MSSYRRGRPWDFLLPFLIIVCLGVIVVLVLQLYMTWKEGAAVSLRNEVFLYYDDGRASLLPWGATQWSKAYSGSLVLEGDRVKTEAGTNLVLVFFNGAVVRLDENTTLDYHTFSDVSGVQIFSFTLESGRLWVNNRSPDNASVHFSIMMGDMVVSSRGTIFEVARSNTEKSLRVLDGSVQADIFESRVDEPTSTAAIASQVVGVGQQVVLSTALKARLLARETVDFLESIDDAWKTTEWYVWNTQEDALPTDFAAATISTPTQDPTILVSPVVTNISMLALTNPLSAHHTVDGEQIYVTGTASPDVVKVTVTAYLNTTTDVYELKKFVPGSGVWSYNAALVYGNMEKGDTRYVIIGEDESGVQTEPLEVVLRIE